MGVSADDLLTAAGFATSGSNPNVRTVQLPTGESVTLAADDPDPEATIAAVTAALQAVREMRKQRS